MTSDAPSRWDWRNWPVLVKLVAVLLVPTMVALVVGALRVVDQAGAVPSYHRIAQVTEVRGKLFDLVGALQRERDLAGSYVATGRSGDTQPLELQFRAVGNRAAELRASADQVQDLGPTGYAAVLDELRGLRPLRQSVLSGTGSAYVAISDYNAAIDPLVTLDAALVRQLDAVAVAGHAAATHALLAGREQISRQHAIVLAALYANRIERVQIDQIRATEIRLSTHQEEFAAALDPAERDRYLAQVTGDSELARQRLMQLVLNRGLVDTPLDVAQGDWSERNAVAIAEITQVENELRQRIEQTARILADQARATAGWNTVILSFALVLGVFIGIMVARSLLRPLGVLKRTALDVADRRLPAAMARIRDGDVPDEAIDPVPVNTREEVGQVARAFDEVHRQAVRLAAEQARLRAHVNDIFVNLSRRSQSLVERQLQLIDRLESSEQDPQQLENLFQLDHLATRMRRNNDNLLVLAGTEATRRTSRPVRLIDVLRAAVSEVEQYQRVVLQQPVNVLVLGRTASDLVHLLAELLDNATQFSPPDTPVIVTAELVSEGSVVVEVVDRGVGMTETEIAEANERLAGTPVVDASVSRRMGLFVVGRLAVRHGIGVWLRAGDDGIGVCASVNVPSRLVRPASEGPETLGVIPTARVLPAVNGVGTGSGAGTGAGVGAEPERSEHATASAAATAVPGRATAPGTPVGGNGLGGGNGMTVTVQAGATGADLFRPAVAHDHQDHRDHRDHQAHQDRAGTAVELAGGTTTPGDATPIYNDVASVWFRAPDQAPDQVRDRTPARTPERSDHQLAADPIGQGGTEPASAAGQGGSAAGEQRGEQRDWGSAADEGWQAASILTQPVGADVTTAGLPRRKPRALLVPGVAAGDEPVEQPPSSTPTRSAESVRGRLASYQRGIQEGRLARHRPHHDPGGPHRPQEAAEETT